MITLSSNAVEKTMKELFNSWSVKGNRLHAAVEAHKFGRFGTCYIAKVLSVLLHRYMRRYKSWERCLKKSMISASA